MSAPATAASNLREAFKCTIKRLEISELEEMQRLLNSATSVWKFIPATSWHCSHEKTIREIVLGLERDSGLSEAEVRRDLGEWLAAEIEAKRAQLANLRSLIERRSHVPNAPSNMQLKISAQFGYHFHAVGQGLFTSGFIRKTDEVVPLFLWVYDCGTSSSPKLVDGGIQRLESWAGTRNRIDLLTLSHFDHDHISGVVRLLPKFQIGTLMLPYMPLAQRLIVAFEERSGSPDDPLTGFYVNPVEFLLGQDGARIERILFVLPSGGDGPAFPPEGPEPKVHGPDDRPSLDFNPGRPDDEEMELLEHAARNAGRGTSVEFLSPGSAIVVRTCRWEFVPYNDDPEVKITDEFIKAAQAERSNLLAASKSPTRDDALKRLKQTYDAHFGSGSAERNIISLFLYAGPIYPSWRRHALGVPLPMPLRQLLIEPWQWQYFPEFVHLIPGERCSILYSGDGYLDSAERLRKLTRYLQERRIQSTGVFQVMHHGAESNWHQGVACEIAPRFSVFSSDPQRKKWRHPHAPVLRDFWPFGPVQVDKDSGFAVLGLMD